MKLVSKGYTAIKDSEGRKIYLPSGVEVEHAFSPWIISQVCTYAPNVTIELDAEEAKNFYCMRYAPREYCGCLQIGRIKLGRESSNEKTVSVAPEALATDDYVENIAPVDDVVNTEIANTADAGADTAGTDAASAETTSNAAANNVAATTENSSTAPEGTNKKTSRQRTRKQ